ncbi:MAG: hypothetical protein E7618_02290 [Ruminococcaceae bacterium]|nr:hypothetical protein [Oscillospiraceae bacterium]
MKESIEAALRGEFGHITLPPVGTVYDEDHTVILCPICEHKTLDNHEICRHCGWEYDGFPEDHYSAANGATPIAYREAYRKAKRHQGDHANED